MTPFVKMILLSFILFVISDRPYHEMNYEPREPISKEEAELLAATLQQNLKEKAKYIDLEKIKEINKLNPHVPGFELEEEAEKNKPKTFKHGLPKSKEVNEEKELDESDLVAAEVSEKMIRKQREELNSVYHPPPEEKNRNVLGIPYGCIDSLFYRKKLDIHCIKLIIAKLIGYGIILGSIFLKIPQLITIYSTSSVAGLSTSSFILSSIGYLINFAFGIANGYPFSAYGENSIIMIQDIICLIMIAYYNKKLNKIFFFSTTLFILFAIALLSGRIPYMILVTFQSLTILIFTASKVPQIILNYRSGSTGVLSFISWFLMLSGSLARVFTSYFEAPHPIILIGFITASFFNGIIVCQILYYWPTKIKEKTK